MKLKQKRLIINIVLMIFLLLIFIVGLIFVFSASSNAKSIVIKMAPRIDFFGSREIGLENLFYSYMFRFLIIGIFIALISGIGIIFNTYILYKNLKK
jgi:hypothetical protein